MIARAGIAGLALLLAAPTKAAPNRPQAEAAGPKIEFFEKSIRPVLVNECQSCHGPTRQDGGLRVDSRKALLAGGNRGRAIAPGEPSQSLLLRALTHRDAVLKMPPKGRLPDRTLAALGEWIRDGAAWPADGEQGESASKSALPRADASHWSLQPLRITPPPRVRRQGWVITPIDAFILKRLEDRGLSPAPPADRETLIRRLSFDLTGLPPTVAEVDAFVADRSANAYGALVERLLASPAYGERWGRHWLDVARYADSNGLDENLHYGSAWRYRDYVVAAMNGDVPYDRFVQEQIAGDLLPAADEAARRRQRTATGFLALGPKVLAEPDPRKMEMDIIDEQIDTLGRVFMGLTLGCARCHDHKFDPISMEDYYALAGIFKSTKTMEHFKIIARWYEHPMEEAADLARKAEHDGRVAAQKKLIQTTIDAAIQALRSAGKPVPEKPEPAFPEATRMLLKSQREALASLEKAAPDMPGAMGVTEGEVQSLPIHLRGSHLTLGKKVERNFPAVLTGGGRQALPAQQSGRLELARWLSSPEHPLTARVMVNRVWRWHFGSGLVASTDNYGMLGDRPSHPELLDWLAGAFAGRPGAALGGPAWSLKALHRLIVHSNTYRMSHAVNLSASRVDPENRLRWRFDLRRLEAEELRDALLASAGLLDREMGGSLVKLKNREFFFDHTSKDGTKYDSRRRSLYLPIVRNHLYDVFQLFDYGDAQVPEGNRATTTVAPQALFMLNSSLVRECADALARQLLETPGLSDAGRIGRLLRAAYGRNGRPVEVARADRSLTRLIEARPADAPPDARRKQAWSWLCQSVLCSSEFVYVR